MRVAASDGRLAPEELDERIERAMSARTRGDLEQILRDLPDVPATAKDMVEVRARTGKVERTGSWIVPRRTFLEWLLRRPAGSRR